MIVKTLKLVHESQHNRYCAFEYTDGRESQISCARHSQSESDECGNGCKNKNGLLWIICSEQQETK